MNGFTSFQMPREGFFARLFRRPSPKNAHFAIQNLLAQTSIREIPADGILHALEPYRVGTADLHGKMKEIYGTVLRHFSCDLELSDAEIEDLRYLKLLLDLSDSDVLDCERKILDPYFESTLADMLKDRRLSTEERGRLAELAKHLRLPEVIAKKIQNMQMSELMQSAFSQAISDRRLSTEEEAELAAIAKDLDAEIKMDETSKAELDHFRLLWRLEQGDLPEAQVPILLRKGEVCYLSGYAGHSEFRSVTRSIRYGGPAVRVRIMKGLYYRAGQVNVQRISEDVLTNLDVGQIYLTNKRIVFNGSKKNTTIALAKVLDFDVYSDGLKIEKETGKDQFFQMTGSAKQMEIWGATLRGALKVNRA
jgi:hypothetical protein